MTCGVAADESNKRRKFQHLHENKLKAEGVDIFQMLLLVLRHVVLTYHLHNVRRNFEILTVDNVSCPIFPSSLILNFDTFSDAPTYTNLAFYNIIQNGVGAGWGVKPMLKTAELVKASVKT